MIFRFSGKGSTLARGGCSTAETRISKQFWDEIWTQNHDFGGGTQNVTRVAQDHFHYHLVWFERDPGPLKWYLIRYLCNFAKKFSYGGISGTLFRRPAGISGTGFGTICEPKIKVWSKRSKMLQDWCRITPTSILYDLKAIPASFCTARCTIPIKPQVGSSVYILYIVARIIALWGRYTRPEFFFFWNRFWKISPMYRFCLKSM